MPSTKLQVNCHFGSAEEAKKHFQDCRHGGHLGFPINTIFLMLPSKIHVNLPFGSKEEANNLFSRWPPWQPSWLSDRKNFSFFFYLQVILMLHTKFQVNWPFDSGEEAKERCSIWPPWWPSWISNRNNFSCIWSTSLYDASYQVKVSWLSGSADKAKNRFSSWPLWQASWISDRTILVIFSLWFTPRLPTKFRVNWLFRLGKEATTTTKKKKKKKKKKRFTRLHDGGHSGLFGFPIRMLLAIFDIQMTLMLPTKFQVDWRPFLI